jgi:4-hydroxy-2-oxoheptanedioate aldolase
MPAPRNDLKHRLARGELLRGLWLNLGSGLVAEIAGQSGFDWCLIDGEHGPWDPAAIRAQLIALAATPAQAVVRVPMADDWVLKQLLDLGAQSVLVPMIDSADQARAVVRACRYPPEGVRGQGALVARASGFHAQKDYTTNANDEICILVQAESRAALTAIEQIAAVDGVDGIFIGPADLAADMGHRDDPGHPEVQAAIADAIPRIRATGKAAGIILGTPEARAEAVRRGVNFIGMGSEATLLAEGLRALGAERPA